MAYGDAQDHAPYPVLQQVLSSRRLHFFSRCDPVKSFIGFWWLRHGFQCCRRRTRLPPFLCQFPSSSTTMSRSFTAAGLFGASVVVGRSVGQECLVASARTHGSLPLGPPLAAVGILHSNAGRCGNSIGLSETRPEAEEKKAREAEPLDHGCCRPALRRPLPLQRYSQTDLELFLRLRCALHDLVCPTWQ